jgi:hypothetical protein
MTAALDELTTFLITRLQTPYPKAAMVTATTPAITVDPTPANDSDLKLIFF